MHLSTDSLDTFLGSQWVLWFDIDGTLVDSAGAGRRALMSALKNVFGLTSPQCIPLHGRTDCGIFQDLCRINQVSWSTESRALLEAEYLRCLPRELAYDSGRILPGVLELLQKLTDSPHCRLGLLTGNIPPAAKLKLQAHVLWDFFEFGVFGDASPDRLDLAPLALEKASSTLGLKPSADRVIVIGDTIDDIRLAQMMGVRSIAVCTGGGHRRELAAQGPHFIFDDLSDTELILKILNCPDDGA
ncbi:MAG: HAD family hydrolase [Planctomycetales bacterium]|nr:HAD family hydrolase [Planctomycetales bacterium]